MDFEAIDIIVKATTLALWGAPNDAVSRKAVMDLHFLYTGKLFISN